MLLRGHVLPDFSVPISQSSNKSCSDAARRFMLLLWRCPFRAEKGHLQTRQFIKADRLIYGLMSYVQFANILDIDRNHQVRNHLKLRWFDVLCTVCQYPGYWTETIRWQTIFKKPDCLMSFSQFVNSLDIERWNHQVTNHLKKTIWFTVLGYWTKTIRNETIS